MSAQVVILIAKLKILVIHQICIPPKIISGVLSHIVLVHQCQHSLNLSLTCSRSLMFEDF